MCKLYEKVNLDLALLFNHIYNEEDKEAKLDCGFWVINDYGRFYYITDGFGFRYTMNNPRLKGDLLIVDIDEKEGNVELLWLEEGGVHNHWVKNKKDSDYHALTFYLTKDELESCILRGV